MFFVAEMFPLLNSHFVLDVTLAVALSGISSGIHIIVLGTGPCGLYSLWLLLCSVLLSILFLGGVRKNECTFYMQSV